MKVLILLFIALHLYASAILHVDELISIALKNSPDLNISALNKDQSKERIAIARSYYLPKIDALLNGGYSSVSQKSNSSDYLLVRGSVSASQLLFDFGKTTDNIDAYSYDANASQYNFYQQVSNKIFAIKQRYYTLLQTKNLELVYDENVKINRAQYIRAKRYFQAGIKTKIDVSDANVRLIESQLLKQKAHYDIDLAKVELLSEMGIINNRDDYQIYTPKLTLPYIYETLKPIDTNATYYEAYAYTHRYEILEYRAKIKSAQSTAGAKKSDYYPTIYANANAYAQSVPQELEALLPSQSWQATLNLNWNLFSGFHTQHIYEVAKLDTLKAQSTLMQKKLAIKLEVDNALINLLKQRDNVKLSQALLIASKEKFVQSTKRYEQGLSDFIELEQSRKDYIDASTELINYYYAYFIALAQLDRAIGK